MIGPDATGVGWVFEYALVDETGQHNLAELRSFQDWHLRYWLASVPGVAEVASIGGFVKQYQVNLDPNKLAAYRHVSEAEHALDVPSGEAPAIAGGEPRTVPYDQQPRLIIRAAKQVARAIFFSLAIIVISFVPVFLLEAQEGRMFRPLAFTKTFAMMAASILSVTLVPVLMIVFIRGKRLKPESENPISRFFTWIYDPIIRLALRWKWGALLVNFAVVPLTIPLLFVIGSEFMPPLYEGSQLYMPTAPPGLSITEATRLLQVQDKMLRKSIRRSARLRRS